MARLSTISATCLIACLLPFGTAATQLAHIVVERNLPLKLVDGTTLYADVYRPEGPGRFPALLMRTPYDKEGAQQSGRLAMTVAAVRRDYVVVVQDTRGQFRSEGRFVPYSQEIGDGDERSNGSRGFRTWTGRSACSASPIPAPCSGWRRPARRRASRRSPRR